MEATFLKKDKPLLMIMLKNTTPEGVMKEIRESLEEGAEAFGLQTENWKRVYHTPEVWKKVFGATEGRPLYVTNYKMLENEEFTYEELAEELLTYPEYGATLCDVMGDMFCKHPEELTEDEQAVRKQKELIAKLHEKGAEVVMSSHVNKFIPAERVLEIALAQQSRGADVVKIVTHAENMEQQIENLRITQLLKERLNIPYLFLSGGECKMHRRLGMRLGCCMSLCVCRSRAHPDNPQPWIQEQKMIRDNMQF